MAGTRRRFDPEFREGAVRIVRETGKPIAVVARELGASDPRRSALPIPDRKYPGLIAYDAFCAMRGSPRARSYYHAPRARGIGQQAALRQLGNRLIGILHRCLKTRTRYHQDTACSHHTQAAA